MKTKRFNKKLTINKQTVSNLDTIELSKIHGGMRTFVIDGPPSCISATNFLTCYTLCGPDC
jgi:hypothetical protein